ncbi:hypothetical protein FRC01_000284 [Tulasnella sp. 417]|nr:hypothetical protein FRC01_000284 [Tulasnella sp. 417]
MPEEIHMSAGDDHYYAVAAHLIHGRPLEDCEKRKRKAREASQKRRKKEGHATRAKKPSQPSNPNFPDMGNDNVDSEYRESCSEPGCYCQNNQNGSLHCGMWCQQGHLNNPERPLAPTQNLACDPTIKGAQAVLDFNQRTTLLHRMVNYVVACVEPWAAGTMISAVQQAKSKYNLIESRMRDMTTMFFGYAFMLNKQTENHCDANSSEHLVDTLVTIGKYSGGKLCLPELGVQAAYGPRSLVVLRGGIIKHGVDHFNGPHRICLAYFAHRSALSHLGIRPFTPRKIVDTQQQPPVFRADAVDDQTWEALKSVAYNHNTSAIPKDDITSKPFTPLAFPAPIA